MLPEAFLQQVAWPGVQPFSVEGGDTSCMGNNGADDDYIVGITATQKIGIQDPHRIEAYFDQDFSLILFICLYLFCLGFIFFYSHFKFLHLG